MKLNVNCDQRTTEGRDKPVPNRDDESSFQLKLHQLVSNQHKNDDDHESSRHI